MNNKIIILLIGMLCCIPISGYIVGAVELGQQFTQQQINSVNPLDIAIGHLIGLLCLIGFSFGILTCFIMEDYLNVLM